MELTDAQEPAGAPLQRGRATGNRLLMTLPESERRRMDAHLEPVDLGHGVVLHAAGDEIEHVYFPQGGVASLVIGGQEGEEVDTAVVGNEGMVGLPVFLGTGQMPGKAMVQIDMEALRMSSHDLRAELERGGALVKLLLSYTQMVVIELAQLVLCNRFHSLEQRAARWILQVNERLPGGPPFDATQEFVAAMLGAHRPHLSAVLLGFRELGLTTYGRGTMQVLDADQLEARACACYRTIRDELDRLLAARERYDITAGG